MINILLKIRVWILSILLLCFLSNVVFATKAAINIGLMGLDARSMGLARAVTSTSGDINGIFSNPAGIGYVEDWEVSSMSTSLVGNVNYLMLAGGYHFDWGVVGLGYLSTSSPAGYYTTDENSLVGASPISYSDSIICISYAKKMNDSIKEVPEYMGSLSFGASLKIIQKGFSGTGVTGSNATGFDMDMGVILRPSEKLSFGLAFTNSLPSMEASKITWTSGEKEILPTTFKAGVSFSPIENLRLMGDVFWIYKVGENLTFHAAGEYTLLDTLDLRAGIDQRVASKQEGKTYIQNNFTMGLGLKFEGFRFDYAYYPDSVVAANTSHYISLGFEPTAAVTQGFQKIINLEIFDLNKEATQEGFIDEDLERLKKLSE